MDYLIGFSILISRIKKTWASRPKLSGWGLIGLASIATTLVLAPQLDGVIAYKFSLTTLSIVMLYWLYRHIWPDSRPSSFMGEDGKVLAGKELSHAAALIAQALFIAICFHGIANLV